MISTSSDDVIHLSDSIARLYITSCDVISSTCDVTGGGVSGREMRDVFAEFIFSPPGGGEEDECHSYDVDLLTDEEIDQTKMNKAESPTNNLCRWNLSILLRAVQKILIQNDPTWRANNSISTQEPIWADDFVRNIKIAEVRHNKYNPWNRKDFNNKDRESVKLNKSSIKENNVLFPFIRNENYQRFDLDARLNHLYGINIHRQVIGENVNIFKQFQIDERRGKQLDISSLIPYQFEPSPSRYYDEIAKFPRKKFPPFCMYISYAKVLTKTFRCCEIRQVIEQSCVISASGDKHIFVRQDTSTSLSEFDHNKFTIYLNQSKLTPELDQDKITPGLNQSKPIPCLNGSNLTPKLDQSKLIPYLDECNLTPKLNESNLSLRQSQSKLSPGLDQSKLTLGLDRNNLVMGLDQCKPTPQLNQRKVTPGVNQNNLIPRVNRSNLSRRVKQNKLIPTLDYPVRQMKITPVIYKSQKLLPLSESAICAVKKSVICKSQGLSSVSKSIIFTDNEPSVYKLPQPLPFPKSMICTVQKPLALYSRETASYQELYRKDYCQTWDIFRDAFGLEAFHECCFKGSVHREESPLIFTDSFPVTLKLTSKLVEDVLRSVSWAGFAPHGPMTFEAVTKSASCDECAAYEPITPLFSKVFGSNNEASGSSLNRETPWLGRHTSGKFQLTLPRGGFSMPIVNEMILAQFGFHSSASYRKTKHMRYLYHKSEQRSMNYDSSSFHQLSIKDAEFNSCNIEYCRINGAMRTKFSVELLYNPSLKETGSGGDTVNLQTAHTPLTSSVKTKEVYRKNYKFLFGATPSKHASCTPKERLWRTKRHLAIAGLLSFFYPCDDMRVTEVNDLPARIMELISCKNGGQISSSREEVKPENVKVVLILSYEASMLMTQGRSQLLVHLALALDVKPCEILCLTRYNE